MNFKALEKNICDAIKEGQIKIGYNNNPIRLYYPTESVTQLICKSNQKESDKRVLNEISNTATEDVLQLLNEFVSQVEPRLGLIDITEKNGRICFKIPKEGVTYIHEEYYDNGFLRKFLEAITKSGVELNEILQVFHEFSDDVVHDKSSDFGDVLYFLDENIDEYVYCVKFDEFGATYHRFTREDFAQL